MNKASTMLNIGSRYQNEGLTLINACDIRMDIANTVEIKVLMTVGQSVQVICFFVRVYYFVYQRWIYVFFTYIGTIFV